MTKNEQIEEMHREFENWDDTQTNLTLAEWMYSKGYRKASEVAREIFEELEKARKKWDTVYDNDHFGYNGSAFGYLETDVDHTIYELKKKYGGSQQ